MIFDIRGYKHTGAEPVGYQISAQQQGYKLLIPKVGCHGTVI